MRAIGVADFDLLVNDNDALHVFIDHLQVEFGLLNDAIAGTYFLPATEAGSESNG